MNDVDILAIDAEIHLKFQKELDDLPDLEKRLAELGKSMRSTTLRQRLKDSLIIAHKEMEQYVNNIKSRNEHNFYVAESIPLLQAYRDILNVPMKISFVGKQVRNDKEKRKIVEEYLTIARNHIHIISEKPSKKRGAKVVCSNCNNRKEFDVVDGNIHVCGICSAEQSVVHHISSYNDVDRVNISSKYMYDRKVHFRDCMNQYQGKQNSTVAPIVYTNLEKELAAHHLLLPQEKKFNNVTKEHISMFLKELGYTKHYENVHLIHYNMTGKKPDNISHLEDQLLDDFDSLTALYDKRFKSVITRKNFINTQYVLFQLLKRHKHPCRPEDFTILKTMDRKFFHDDICRVLFEELGWNHLPSF
jgi:hypothetical protein